MQHDMRDKYTWWRESVGTQEMYRRAGGRRHYNAVRKFRAAQRRKQLIELCLERGISLLDHGALAALAGTLGVHRSTILRDLRAMQQEVHGQPCPLCGSRIIVDPRRRTGHTEED